MNISIPFNKIVPFKSSIAEICSISLEHDISINDSELLGDFLVSGEYKNLDINIDTIPFEHVIPFSVKLDEDIIIDTLSYEVEDFSYEIVDSNSLKVNIILHVSADKNVTEEKIFDEKPEVDEEDRLKLLDEENEETISDQNTENKIDESKEVTKDDIDLIKSSNLKEDYITYHIHIVKINETIDSISADYKIEKDKILELNDISSIQVGDKIIIPDLNE